ncbi:MAG: GDP-L-fucose synthase [Candidatus Doudnabacteria bacterium]|nr:GDP-L-fucose synthase [Candidatus Doudnabacteria bacterium]
MSNLKNTKILLTGGNGFLGREVFRQLIQAGVNEKNIFSPSSKRLDLRLARNAAKAVKGIELVIHLAANVGGIGYNQNHPAKLFYDNAIMGLNLIEEARKAGVKKFVQVGTVCAYPKFTPVPFKESYIWNGYPEETNAPYGLAKKMLLAQLQSYRQEYGFNGVYLIPVNLYGPGDNFKPESSHVIPALIKKFVEAANNNNSEVVVWGSGKASREFLFVTDAARGIILAAQNYNKPEPINLGAHFEITIKDLANLIAKLSGFKGKIIWDKTKPDGQPRRKLDVSQAKKEFGFVSKVKFEQGLKQTIEWYKKNYAGILSK